MSSLIDRLAARAIGVERPAVRAIAAVRVRAPLVQADAAQIDEGGVDVVAQRLSIGDAMPEPNDAPSRSPPRVATAADDAQPARGAFALAEPARAVARANSPHVGMDDSHTEPASLQRMPVAATNVRAAKRAAAQPLPYARHETPTAVPERIPPAAPLHDGAVTHRADGGAEPTELHIHIGRIDVTGVEASVERKRPARQARSRSLEDYLAGRTRGSS